MTEERFAELAVQVWRQRQLAAQAEAAVAHGGLTSGHGEAVYVLNELCDTFKAEVLVGA
jgi:hypothetical protein